MHIKFLLLVVICFFKIESSETEYPLCVEQVEDAHRFFSSDLPVDLSNNANAIRLEIKRIFLQIEPIIAVLIPELFVLFKNITKIFESPIVKGIDLSKIIQIASKKHYARLLETAENAHREFGTEATAEPLCLFSTLSCLMDYAKDTTLDMLSNPARAFLDSYNTMKVSKITLTGYRKIFSCEIFFKEVSQKFLLEAKIRRQTKRESERTTLRAQLLTAYKQRLEGPSYDALLAMGELIGNLQTHYPLPIAAPVTSHEVIKTPPTKKKAKKRKPKGKTPSPFSGSVSTVSAGSDDEAVTDHTETSDHSRSDSGSDASSVTLEGLIPLFSLPFTLEAEAAEAADVGEPISLSPSYLPLPEVEKKLPLWLNKKNLSVIHQILDMRCLVSAVTVAELLKKLASKQREHDIDAEYRQKGGSHELAILISGNKKILFPFANHGAKNLDRHSRMLVITGFQELLPEELLVFA